MKQKKQKIDKSITRKYTCTRRVNKENKKIWVVLEDGRKFYRIFQVRSDAIKYFEGLKTINAEMLIQDLKENVYSSITYTKMAVKARGLIEASSAFDGGIVEDSDKLFDEDVYVDFLPDNNIDEDEVNINTWNLLDLSFVDDMFPKQPPLIQPVKINPPVIKEVKMDKTIISNEFNIIIYQEDLNLSYYVYGDKFYANREKFIEEK